MPTAAMDVPKLESLERRTFDYFIREAHPVSGLVPDSTRAGAPCSIAVLGFALAAYPVGIERGWLSRREGAARTLRLLEFLAGLPRSDAADAAGYRGFFYHFLDMETGGRAWRSELSSIDNALLFAGVLTAAGYYRGPRAEECRVRALADELFLEADWSWMQNGSDEAISHGWTPERGFLRYRWEGYNEALILIALALGSPTRPATVEAHRAWTAGFRWKSIYGYEHFYAGPLFIHQLSQLWIDARGIRDATMRDLDLDYFENSRRAVLVQREYARTNPRGFAGYHANCWGITASDGPGRAVRRVGGRVRRFWGYRARGVPFGPDDGTLSPWVVFSSLPYAESAVLEALDHITREYPDITDEYGLMCSFNPTFPGADVSQSGRRGWIADGHYGLNQGPILLMGENHRSGLIWSLTRADPYVRRGLERAGFRGGWLDT